MGVILYFYPEPPAQEATIISIIIHVWRVRGRTSLLANDEEGDDSLGYTGWPASREDGY